MRGSWLEYNCYWQWVQLVRVVAFYCYVLYIYSTGPGKLGGLQKIFYCNPCWAIVQQLYPSATVHVHPESALRVYVYCRLFRNEVQEVPPLCGFLIFAAREDFRVANASSVRLEPPVPITALLVVRVTLAMIRWHVRVGCLLIQEDSPWKGYVLLRLRRFHPA